MVPPLDFIDELDMCSIVGNIWENAIKGCLDSDCDPKQIRFKTDISHNHFMLEMANSYSSLSDSMASKSELGHGLGLKIIERILEKYDGFYTISTSENLFSIHIAIPIILSDNRLEKINAFYWKNY